MMSVKLWRNKNEGSGQLLCCSSLEIIEEDEGLVRWERSRLVSGINRLPEWHGITLPTQDVHLPQAFRRCH